MDVSTPSAELPHARRRRAVLRFAQCEKGATALEYGLVASLMGLAVITALKIFGTPLSAIFSSINTNMSLDQ